MSPLPVPRSRERVSLRRTQPRKGKCIVKNSTITVDPGLEGVVVGETALSRVAGEEGRLTYRGYDIADLAANASFEEVAYLLWYGRLPNASEFADLRGRMAAYRPLPEPLLAALRSVPLDAW